MMTAEEILKKKGGLFRVKINLAEAFDEQDTDALEMLTQADGTSHYIVLREYRSGEMLELQQLESGSIGKELSARLGEFIVEHSFLNDKGEDASIEQVVQIIKLSGSLMMFVIEQWQNSLPLVRRMLKASAERQE